MVDGATTPPPLLQEADLIGLMEKHGIGKNRDFPYTHHRHLIFVSRRKSGKKIICTIQWNLLIRTPSGPAVLSSVERLSSFRGDFL